MIELLEEIFQNNGFDIHRGVDERFEDIANGFIGVLEDRIKGKFNYYLVIEVNDIGIFRIRDNNPNSYRKLFEYITKLEIYNPFFDKNLSLLIVWKVTNLDISVLDSKENIPFRRYISDIEENPYFFKKQVLFYREEELVSFKERFKEDKVNLMEIMPVVLSDESLFKELKDNHYQPTYYSLLTRLYIKISFLIMKIRKKELEDLQEEINKKIIGLISFKDEILKNTEWENSDEVYEDLIDKLYNQIEK